MGDVILVTGLLSFLRKKFSDAAISLLTDEYYTGLFSDDPRLSSLIGLSRKQLSLDSVASETQWDIIIDLQNNSRSRKLIGNIKNKSKISSFDKLHLHRFLLLCGRVDIYNQNENIASRYIQTFDKTEKNIYPVELFFDESKAEKCCSDYFQNGTIQRPLMALFPFSKWKNKEWPEEYFIKVGRFFLLKGWNVVVMGGQSESEQGQRIAKFIGQRCVNLAGKLSLYECGCILRKTSMALGVDTGLSHLARACGVKIGMIFGPTTRQFGFFPYGEPPFVLFETNLKCRPCHAHGGNLCLRGNKPCMTRIEPDEVIKGLMELSEK